MPTVEFQLYGDEAKVNACLEESLPNIRVIHCSEKINSDDEPVKAIRSKKDASMVVAAKAVKEGEADALLLREIQGSSNGWFISGWPY